MADKDISDIFDQAVGAPDPIDSAKHDDKDISQIFQDAHDQPSQAEVIAASQAPTSSGPGTNPQDWSKLQSLGQGTVQGATAGFSDELGGAEGAVQEKLLNALQGKKTDKSLGDLYKEYRDFQRQRNDAAQSANPKSNFTGNILGGIGAVAATGAGPALNTIKGTAALGGLTGLGTSNADLTDPNSDNLKQAALDTGIGAGAALLGKGVATAGGKLINQGARKLGQAGVNLLTKSTGDAIKKESADLAENIVEQIKSTKGNIGAAYQKILADNAGKKIDLSSVVENLQQRAAEMDTSLPEQARDKKAITNLILNLTQGPESEQITGFAPGAVKNADVVKGFIPSGTTPQGPNAQEMLEQEAQKLMEQNKQLGLPTSSQVTPSDDGSMVTRVLRSLNANGEPTAVAKTIPNTPGTPAFSSVTPNIQSEPFSQEINPITSTVRQGGSLTPDVADAGKLRTNLGTLANEKSLTTAGNNLADRTYSDLTNSLKDQVPGLADADNQYSAIKSVMKRLGINGAERMTPEDISSVLTKLKSGSPGRQIVNDAALNDLNTANPKLASSISDSVNNISSKQDLYNQAQSWGNLGLDSTLKGLAKAIGGSPSALGNLIGLAENKVAKTAAGALVQKALPSASSVTQRAFTSPVANEAAQTLAPQFISPFRAAASTEDNTQATATKVVSNLYNATDDSLRDVAGSLSKQPSVASYGQSLNKAIEENDTGAKNRAIFLIMQNPQARKMITPTEE